MKIKIDLHTCIVEVLMSLSLFCRFRSSIDFFGQRGLQKDRSDHALYSINILSTKVHQIPFN